MGTQDVVDKFVNGESRYETQEVFKTAVDALAGGLGVYAVLDSTLAQLAASRSAVKMVHAENALLRKELNALKEKIGE